MGASANVAQNVASSIVNAYTNMIMEQVASCSSTLAQNQHIKISGLRSKGPVIIEGIKMKQKSVLSPNCASNLTGSQKTKSALANLQAQLAKAVSHSTPLNVSANFTYNTSDMVTQVLNTVQSKSIQNCINQAFNNQSLEVKNISSDTEIKIGNIDMDQANKSVAKCVFDSVQNQLGDVKALSELQQAAESKSKMISTGVIVAIVVGLVVIIIAAIVGYVLYKKSKDKQAAEEHSLKKSMAEKGVDAKDVVGGESSGSSEKDMATTAAKLAMASTPQGAALSMLL